MVERTKRKESSGQQQELPAKRQRVSRACDQCRAARERCDGAQPLCFTCATSNRPCSYTTPPKKRGIQPGYIRALELTLAWLFEHVPEAEEKLRTSLNQEAVAALITSRDEEGSARLHKSWRKHTTTRDLERLLGTVRPDPDLDVESSYDDYSRSLAPADDAQLAASNPAAPERSRTRLPNNYWRLLDVYFAYTHTWLPIVQKHEMLRLTYAYGEEGLALDTESDAQHAELWAIFAIAAAQEEAAAAIPIAKRSYQRNYNIARGLIPGESSSQAIGHVKALLLLSLIKIGAGAWSAAWLLLGQAISVAVDQGLHEHHDGPELARRKHTVLGCFFLEVLLCAFLDRTPRLSSIDIAALGPADEEGLEEWNPWSACEGFIGGVAQDGAEMPSARVPNFTMSILNQMVMLSNAMRSGSSPVLASLPQHLRGAGARLNTPQLIHLHLLRACFVSDVRQAQELVVEHAHKFGVTTMAPLFGMYALMAIKRSSAILPPDIVEALEGLDATVKKVYSVDYAQRDRPDLLQLSSAQTHEQSASTLEMIGATPTLPAANRAENHSTAMAPPVQFDINRSSDLFATSCVSLPEDPLRLERLPSNTIDVDALFDELASLDRAEDATHHPIFMQNLGLAPNTDFNDLLGFDLGFDLPFSHPQPETSVNGYQVPPDPG